MQLSKSTGTAPVSGDYIVGPDGTINLKEYGTLEVTGKTIAEATSALEKHLTKYFDSPEVAVEVKQFNSKVFYVITEGVGAGAGDNIRRVPITGNDIVLDALSVVSGLSQISSKKIWISRPSASNPEKGTVLPVDYAAITAAGPRRPTIKSCRTTESSSPKTRCWPATTSSPSRRPRSRKSWA